MKRVAGILAVGGGLILIFWVTSPAARTPAAAPELSAADLALADQAAQAIPPIASQVDEQAARLRARLAEPPQKPQPTRNPFRFKGTEVFSTEKHRRGTGVLSPKSVENTPVPFVSAPAISLPAVVAITADARDGGLMRTAVLSMHDEMKNVRPGQAFDRFVVEAIGPDSVRLVDITSPTRATFVVAIR